MKLAICNEFCEGWDIERVFKLAKDTGYDGVEIAPFTLAPDVNDISGGQRRRIVEQARQYGMEIIGLHWLLASPEGLPISHPDDAIRNRTAEYFKSLINFCGDPNQDGSHTIRTGATFPFTYRLYFHADDTEEADVAGRFLDHLSPPNVELAACPAGNPQHILEER